MKQSVTQLFDFFKKHKYGRMGLALLLVGLFLSSFLLFQAKQQEEPIPLSEVAAALSAGRGMRIEDIQDRGSLTIYYKDGSQDTTRRDKGDSFLEQMQYLGVSENQMAKLQYEIVEASKLTGEKAINTLVSVAMLGLMAFALTRVTGGGLMAFRK